MILKSIRMVGAVVVAVAVTLVLLIAVEFFSAVVHPFPSEFQGTTEEICAHVARYPHWVLAVVVPMWGGTAWIGTFLAGRLGNLGCAVLLAMLLLAAVIWNISMLPYPLWFKIVQPLVIFIAVISGGRTAYPRSQDHAESAVDVS